MGEFLLEAVEFGTKSNITVAEKQRTDSISMNLSYRRRKEVQEEIAIDRECKKLEKVWKNRGLPVDRETLRSAASKDVFDMRSLSESLPSTSEKKPTIKELRRKQHPKWPLPSCSSRHHLERFQRFKNCSHFSYTPMLSGLCHRTLPPDGWNFTIEHDIKSLKQRAQLRERLNIKFNEISLQFEELPAFDEQDETSKDSEISFVEMNKDSDLDVRKIAFFNAPGQIFTGIPLCDKNEEQRKEHQNSDIENNHNLGCVVGPVSKVSRDMNFCSSYNSRKNWIQDFQPPVICPRFQSFNQKQESFYRRKANWETQKARRNTLRELHKHSKIRAMGSRRGVLIGDKNGSEIENPSIKIDSRISDGCNQNHHTLDISTKKDVSSMTDRLKLITQKLWEVRKSLNHTRSLRRRLSIGNLKSDKVVPD